MAKLKCDKHKRRVLAINNKFVHRGGWGDTCDSPTATIGESTMTAQSICEGGIMRAPKKDKKDG